MITEVLTGWEGPQEGHVNAQTDHSEVMTLAQVAKYLHLAERTVLRMAQRGEIPAAKIASQWRFMRSLVCDWLVAQMQTLPSRQLEAVGGLKQTLLPLGEVLRPDLMSFNLKPGPKENIFRQLLTPLLRTGFARDTDELLKRLLDREAMMTTAVGHGIAVPHPRRPVPGMFSEPAIALGICPEGTDFQAIDDQLVHVFFLICATRIEIHLQLMAKVSWLSRRNVTQRLRGASSAEEVAAIVAQVVGDLERRPQV